MRRLVPLALLVLAGAVPAAAHAQASSSFAQLTGDAGCVVQTLPADFYGSGDTSLGTLCANGHGLMQADAVTVSPDQASVYATAGGTPRAGSNAVVSFARDATTGALKETGCTSDDGGDGRTGSDGLCTDGDALGGANDVAISPDGANAYVASGTSNGLAWFDRDKATGKLTQAGCFKAVPRYDRCGQANGLMGADGVTVSPDGHNVYVASGTDDAVTAFTRDPATGAVTPIGCISATGNDGACKDGTALAGASAVAVSPDGAFVYVTAALISAITIYARDPATGALTPAGCILDVAPEGGACKAATALAGASAIALTPDGKQVYVAASGNDSVLTFARDAATGGLTQTGCVENADPVGDDAVDNSDSTDNTDNTDNTDSTDGTSDPTAAGAQADPVTCDKGKALYGVDDLTLSADGRSLFAASSGELASFDRSADGATLTQTGCVEEDPTYKSCSTGVGLYGASGLASSADGRNLYVASRNAHTVSVFGAAVAITTRATRVRGRVARVHLACPAARARGCTGRLRLATSSRAYRLARGAQRTYAVRVPAALRRTAARHHRARVTVRATDARHLTRATTRRLTLKH